MGYQALLFCPDDKLARVVSQVFTELDFTVEPVQEPFGAVKKLMTQRYDAIVVDCENEQNASLLFKSARNSSSNQSSLAIAVVEGQAGVAKAYRIGANLVLTKPINIEQAKGTLRVARGLLRKNSDAASANPASVPVPATSAKIVPVSDIGSSQPASGGAAAITAAAAPLWQEPPKIEAPIPAAIPAVAASTWFDDKPAPVPIPTAQTPVVTEPAIEAHPAASNAAFRSDIVKNNEPMDAVIISAQNARSAFASASGSAAAPAPAKEVSAPAAQEPATASVSYDAVPMFSTTDAPSFQGLGDEDSSGSGSNRKVIIAAAVILVLATLGYFGYGKLGKSNPTEAVQSASAPQNSAEPTPTLAPMSPPATVPAVQTPDRASSPNPSAALKAAIAAPSDKTLPAGNPTTTRIALSPDAEAKKLDSKPIVVKSAPSVGKSQSQDESAAPPPISVAAVSANDSNLTSLVSSASAPRPSLATPKISQGVLQGLLIKRVQPKYPPAALAVRAQGAVQIEATITKEGNVVSPKVLSGDPVLARAAIDAVKQWRYKPYYLDGEPVEIQTQITINFKAN
jgi:protein TonB